MTKTKQTIKNALEKIGVTDEKTLGDFFAAVREPEIMDQELDADELDAVAGGGACDENDSHGNNCVQQHDRPLYVDGKKHCAATVGINKTYLIAPGDLCSTNDACNISAVCYY